MNKKPIYTNELLLQIVTKKLDGSLDFTKLLTKVEWDFPDLYREFRKWYEGEISVDNKSNTHSLSVGVVSSVSGFSFSFRSLV